MLLTSFHILVDKAYIWEKFMNSRRFVANLFQYMCAKIYLSVKSFGKVIGKTIFWDTV